MAEPLRMDKSKRNALAYFIFALIGIVLLRNALVGLQQTEVVPYSELQVLLKDGKIKAVKISGNLVEAELKAPLPGGKTKVIANRVDPLLAKDLDQYGVAYEQIVQSTWLTDIFAWIFPTLVFFG